MVTQYESRQWKMVTQYKTCQWKMVTQYNLLISTQLPSISSLLKLRTLRYFQTENSSVPIYQNKRYEISYRFAINKKYARKLVGFFKRFLGKVSKKN